MTKDIAVEGEVPLLGADWFDPLEAGVRQRIRSFIENMLEEELAATLGRGRYDRSAEGSRASQWPPEAPVARHVRAVNGVGSSSTGDRQRWQAGGVAQQGAAGLQAPDGAGRTADRRRLSGRHQHARGPARLGSAVRRGGWQGHREQGLAQGAVRLGGLAKARSCRGRHRPPDSRRHGCPGSSGQEGDQPFGVGGVGCSS